MICGAVGFNATSPGAGAGCVIPPDEPVPGPPGVNATGLAFPLIFGSSASRNPSPNRLNASTVRKIATAGKSATCGAMTISARASLSIAPHSGVGGCAPNPRNDRLAAEIIDVPIRIVKKTTIDETVPGNIWLNKIVVSLAPILRADSINVCCFKTRVFPRTRRANAGIEKIATATITLAIPLPNTATTAIASKMPGKANSTSQMRIIKRSHQPS